MIANSCHAYGKYQEISRHIFTLNFFEVWANLTIKSTESSLTHEDHESQAGWDVIRQAVEPLNQLHKDAPGTNP